jgi:hypothetical protein
MADEESTNETLMSGGTTTDDYGKVEGSGTERVYITKEGDTLHDVAAFFYGDPAHKQRLVDDNPELTADAVLTPGMRLRVGEDAERGDSVS